MENLIFHIYESGKPMLETNVENLNKYLSQGVVKRLHADVPVGFLCSGGLDSSLVCAIAAKVLDKPLRTFAVGTVTDAIDTKYARIVADFLGADHTEVLFTKQEIFDTLSSLIYNIETYDITTIRASMGMFLVMEGIALVIAPKPLGPSPSGFIRVFNGKVFGLPIALVILILLTLIYIVLLKFTKLGRL